MTNNNEGYTTYVQSADGTKIHYEKRGKGPGLVIIHGAFRDSSHYQKLAQELIQHLPFILWTEEEEMVLGRRVQPIP